MLLLRSVIFNLFFYLWTFVLLIVLIPAMIWPFGNPVLFIGRVWCHGNLWALRIICNLTVDYRGLEKVPSGAVLVAAKHQSAWETFAFFVPFPRPAYIYKRELSYIPLFGWAIWRARQIPVDRGRKGEALASITAGAHAALGRDQQVMIFPEGTRRAVDAPPDYKYGVTHLYSALGATCQPVAHNAGLFWPRRSFLRRPGTVIVECLDPISPGLPPEVFAERLKATIETATNRLVAEARAQASE